MLKSTIELDTNVHITLLGGDGSIKKELHLKNLITTVGKEFIVSRMGGSSANVMSHMAIGTNSTAAAASNTTLGAELTRKALSAAVVTGQSIEYSAVFGAGEGTGAITEAGILNAASAGTLLNRLTFSVVNKDAADILIVNWTVSLL